MLTWPILATLAAAGLIGSLHCLAMCSPFAAVAGRRGPLGGACYSAGRLTSYAALGGIAGGLGAGMHASLSGLSFGSALLAVLAGLALVALGLRALCPPRGGPVGDPGPLGRALAGLYARLVPLARASSGARRPGQLYVLGVVNGLLPCSVTTPVLLAALASGSAVAGSALLLALGVGTLPAMLAAGHLGGRVVGALLGRRPEASAEASPVAPALGLRARAPAVALLALGLLTAARPFLQVAAPHVH